LKKNNLIISKPIYPLFRKQADDKTYYKIISESEFEELKIVGKKYAVFHIKAIKFPEKLYISELIKAGNSIQSLNEQQYLEILKYCQSRFQKI
jgi:hypothetical protein